MEVTALQIGDVTAPNGDWWAALMLRGKGNKALTVPTLPEAYGAISSYVSSRINGAVFCVLDPNRPMGTRAIEGSS